MISYALVVRSRRVRRYVMAEIAKELGANGALEAGEGDQSNESDDLVRVCRYVIVAFVVTFVVT